MGNSTEKPAEKPEQIDKVEVEEKIESTENEEKKEENEEVEGEGKEERKDSVEEKAKEKRELEKNDFTDDIEHEAFYIVCDLEDQRFCLDNCGEGENGGRIQAGLLKKGNENQIFHRVYVMNDYYALVNVKTGKALDMKGQSVEGTEFHSWDFDKYNENQKFDLDAKGDGSYNILTKKGDLAVDLPKACDGGKIQQSNQIYLRENQKWKFIPAGKFKGPLIPKNPLMYPEARPPPIPLQNGKRYYLVCQSDDGKYALDNTGHLEDGGRFEGREFEKGNMNQVFIARPVVEEESATYYWLFQNDASKKVIQAGDERTFQNADFNHHNQHQYFNIKRTEDGVLFNLVCEVGGLALEKTSAREIIQNERSSAPSQKWKFVPFEEEKVE